MPRPPLALSLLGGLLIAVWPVHDQAQAPAEPAGSACSPPGPDVERIGAFLRAGCYKGWAHDQAKVRATGPQRGTASPHGKVRVFYSPAAEAWLRGGRKGPVPDGAILYKEMFEWDTEKQTGGAFMLKQARGSYDGWFWGGFGLRTGKAWGTWAAAGCLNCHASAERELTFASLRHLAGENPAGEAADEPGRAPQRSVHVAAPMKRQRMARKEAAPPDQDPEDVAPVKSRPGPDRRFLDRYPVAWTPGRTRAFTLPDEDLADELVPEAGAASAFLPGASCAACHTAEPPEVMAVPAGDGRYLDLSPHGEWSGSLMGLSGRDPVFLAQVEYEKRLRPGAAAYLDNTCFRCHGVMGQRQMELDEKGAFSQDLLYARPGTKKGRYGTLARDGVSCVACHRISDKGLGQPASFTGRFDLGERGVLYGPYDDNLRTLPMKNALGFEVRGAAHVRGSALCGSCHTVLLPRLPLGAQLVAEASPKSPREHEQTTYLEWQNSLYQDEVRPVSAEARTCQSCHMPETVEVAGKEQALRFKIADIEEYLPHIAGSLPKKEITLKRRQPYRRHTLVGLNYFVLQMFAQFDRLLGVDRRDPEDDERLVPALDLSRRETARLAQRTAVVELSEGPVIAGGVLRARVRVRNLAGHKLPTGVGFRRAFLTFRVLAADGRVLWASGQSDDLGVLVGADGQPLAAEFTTDPRALQPHHDVIRQQEQVQIYEERHADEAGALTTSFVGLAKVVKDNRLLPRGWRKGAPGYLQPVGTDKDPAYQDGSGTDEVAYEVKLPDPAAAARVEATLSYQALPPYFLRTLFGPKEGSEAGREVRRLYHIASRLQVAAPSPIAGWRLPIAACQAPVTRR